MQHLNYLSQYITLLIIAKAWKMITCFHYCYFHLKRLRMPYLHKDSFSLSERFFVHFIVKLVPRISQQQSFYFYNWMFAQERIYYHCQSHTPLSVRLEGFRSRPLFVFSSIYWRLFSPPYRPKRPFLLRMRVSKLTRVAVVILKLKRSRLMEYLFRMCWLVHWFTYTKN